MGNELAQFQTRMTAENWEFLLKMLEKTADKLLVKKKIDSVVKDASFVRKPRMDVFDPPAGPDGNILARIRPVDRKKPRKIGKEKVRKTTMLRRKKRKNNMAFNFGTGKPKRGIASPAILEKIPKAWTEESIKITMENLKKLEDETKSKPAPNPPNKKTEIFPPKPKRREPWTPLNHWTVFGFLPNLNADEVKEAIGEITSKVRKERLGERILYFPAEKRVIGQILPERQAEQRLAAALKAREEQEKKNETPVVPVESETTPKGEGEGEGEEEVKDIKKKSKRKYKKRKPKENET